MRHPIHRRELFALAGGAAAGLVAGCARDEEGAFVNDVHSGLNPTRVRRVVPVDSLERLREALDRARLEGRGLCVAGGRHAMGGQQFGTGDVLLDMRPLGRVLGLDAERGVVHAQAGIQWPELIRALHALQPGVERPWSIVQKQTGADRLTLGGALAANVHGRGLGLAPIVQDVEAFTLMDAQGELRRCSRTESPELFRLAIGGYGLFGVITSVELRLMRRTKLERIVEIADLRELMARLEQRIASGFLYGDCQFSTDRGSQGFLRQGVFSCYRPLPDDAEMPTEVRELSAADWRELYQLAHTDTRATYERYSSYYLSTSGQRYWSDTHQLSLYVDGYHREVDRSTGARVAGSEMISELYVPRPRLADFLERVRADFLEHEVPLVYGTIRLIERDQDSFLAWAREPWACVVMNLHVDHDATGLERARRDFRRLIDRAIEAEGSYFLTYHRWASREQVQRCHPRLREFLEHKREHDPRALFTSDWHRHQAALLA